MHEECGTGRQRWPAGLVVVCLSILGTAQQASGQITFTLVPEHAWTAGQPDPAAALPEGTIALYRSGSYVPEIVLAANEPGFVPEGAWLWIAEAPGYISADSGVLIVGDERQSKTIVWPVVPACTIDLSDPAWRATQRSDFVSLDHGATYPIDVKRRGTVQVPAGRFLAYTVRSEEIVAITGVLACQASELLALAAPAPPPRDRQHFVVTVDLGDEARLQASATLITLSSNGDREHPRQPAARVSVGRSATAFFLDLESVEQILVVTHPERMTHNTPWPAHGGRVTETAITLEPRAALEIPVTYRPLQTHPRAEAQLLFCGEAKQHFMEIGPGRFAGSDCIEHGRPVPLVEGTQILTFEQLDRGQYLVIARIDDEEIPGLEDEVAPFIAPGDTLVRIPEQQLVEHHIFGHILREDEAVEGYVSIAPMMQVGPATNHPTDDDLEYHLYYFAVRDWYDFSAQSRSAKPPGMKGMNHFRACDTAGLCRTFHHRAIFRGSGRFDVALDDGGAISLQVRDARTGDAIARAAVVRRHREGDTPLVFEDGDLRRDKSLRTGEGIMLQTDKSGTVSYLGLESGEHWFEIRADAYARTVEHIQVGDGESKQVKVALEPLEPTGGLRMVSATGTPASQATLFTFLPDGTPDYRCASVADALGEVSISEPCLEDEDRPWIAFARNTALLVTDARQLSQPTDITLPALGGSPLRLRLRNALGEPVTDEPISLRFVRFTLTPDSQLLAARSGLEVQTQTDASGAIGFAFVASEGPLPSIEVGGAVYPLVPRPGSKVIEVVVDH